MFCHTWVTISTDSSNTYFATNYQDPKLMPHVVYALLEQQPVLVEISPQTSAIRFINVPNTAYAQGFSPSTALPFPELSQAKTRAQKLKNPPSFPKNTQSPM